MSHGNHEPASAHFPELTPSPAPFAGSEHEVHKWRGGLYVYGVRDGLGPQKERSEIWAVVYDCPAVEGNRPKRPVVPPKQTSSALRCAR